MATVLKIEILHKPEEKYRVNQIEKILQNAARAANIKIVVVRTNDFPAFSNYNFNPAKTPIVFIERSIEFVGGVPVMTVVKKKLIEVRERGTMLF